jgi:hypothetical protein
VLVAPPAIGVPELTRKPDPSPGRPGSVIGSEKRGRRKPVEARSGSGWYQKPG